jgi:hypothetical protein
MQPRGRLEALYRTIWNVNKRSGNMEYIAIGISLVNVRGYEKHRNSSGVVRLICLNIFVGFVGCYKRMST